MKYGKPYWKAAPFVRMLIALIGGILLQFYFPITHFLLIGMFLIAGIFLVGYSFLVTHQKYKWRFLHGVAILLMIVSMGGLLATHALPPHPSTCADYNSGKKRYYIVTATNHPVEKPQSFKLTAAIKAVQNPIDSSSKKPVWEKGAGNILIYFSKKDSALLPVAGQDLLIYQTMQPIPNSGNPGSFDYKAYCAEKGIYHQVFLRKQDYQLLEKRQGNFYQNNFPALQQNIVSLLKKTIPGKNEAGIAEALLVGYKNDIDPELLKAYSNSGVIHVIAISGMHLGMIYGLLLLLLQSFSNRHQWIRYILIIICLWIFSLITGAGGSVLRACVMLSFVLIGDSLSRKSSTYNTLAASAFFLLCYNPYYLHDIGFQLSYAATTSIVLFMKPVGKWVQTRYRLLNYIWKLSAVTIAAQILTLPLILYHFHQFPNLFLITNLLIVPLTGLLLYSCLLLLVISGWNAAAEILGGIIGSVMKHMNHLITYFNQLNFAVTDGIQLHWIQAVLLYLLIACLATGWLQQKRKYFITALTCFSGFLLFRGLRMMQQVQQQRVIVYNVPKKSAMDLIDGDGYQFIGDTGSLFTHTQQHYYLSPTRTLWGVNPRQVSYYDKNNVPVILFRNKLILLLDKPISSFDDTQKIRVDLMVLKKGAEISLKEISQHFDCRQYVFDSSNPMWKIDYWKKQADSLHLRHHSVPESGAFVLDL